MTTTLTPTSPPALTPAQEALVRDFNILYFHGPDQKHLWETLHWLGVPTLKCPMDLWVFQEILARTRPEVIVECGVYAGGTTLYLASILDLLGTGRIVACDLSLGLVHDRARAHPRIHWIEGSSVEAATVAAVRKQCRGRRTMVILDSDHSYEHVRQELELYSSLVSPDCYLICEDTCVNGHPILPDHGPGPYEALQDFLRTHPGWEVDKHCERLLVTFNPSGYLRRVGGEPSTYGLAREADDNLLRLQGLLQSADKQGLSRRDLFGGCDDDFWYWLHTEGVRRDERLKAFLPGLPDAELQSNYTGHAGDDTLREASGFYRLVKQVAGREVGPLGPGQRVLEFGCGFGRVLRFFAKDLEPDQLWGIDCDFAALSACDNTPPWCSLQLVPAWPPTSLPDDHFDVVYAFSVFSHLSEDAHRRWLYELKRVLKPGGVLIVTTCGLTFFEHCKDLREQSNLPPLWESFKVFFPDYDQAVADYEAGKFCYSPLPERLGALDGSFFGMACIPKAYVLKEWTKEFRFVDFLEGQPFDQHVIVVRKEAGPPRTNYAEEQARARRDATAAEQMRAARLIERWKDYAPSPGATLPVEHYAGSCDGVLQALEKIQSGVVGGIDLSQPDDLPLPPQELCMYVAGRPASDYTDFFTIGRLCVQANNDMLARVGVHVEKCRSMLDFGCGCGRVLRHYRRLTEPGPDGRRPTRLCGTDYNPHQIAWCRANLPFAEFQTNNLMPPLDYPDGHFDFIYLWSVFTHLTEEQQLAWMAEFARVLEPGGYLLISTNGAMYLKNRELPASLNEAFQAGQLVVLYPEGTHSFETYGNCDVYHPLAFVKEHLTQHVRWLECAESEYGDHHLFQKPAGAI